MDYILCLKDDAVNFLDPDDKRLFGYLFPKGTFATPHFFRNYVSNVSFISSDNVFDLYKLVNTLDKKVKELDLVLDLDAYLFHAGAFDFQELQTDHFYPPPPKSKIIFDRDSHKRSIYG